MSAAHIALGRARVWLNWIDKDRLTALSALAALIVWISPNPFPATVQADLETRERARPAAPATSPASERATRREHRVGGYGGVSYTLPSAVVIQKPGSTDLTVTDFQWIGRPFKAPIYYGLRTQHWLPGALTGTMVDFTHAKAIAQRDDVATFSGTLNGQPVAPNAKIGDVFRHLEFSHGHNILTLNGLFRMPFSSWLPVRPYFGIGGGASFPHTEVGLTSEPKRTYEYQFAGFAGQVLAGIEVPLGRVSLFFEYKFTYAPYSVPLSHEPNGWVFVTDIWRQFRAWWTGEEPPGGILTTTLATHHAISGILVRTNTVQPAKK
ncbi:MAG TPA: hypothetical protein VF226_19345 [Hyphomicrobiaceae bacterium]|jgi:hypothetical protein